MQSAKLQYFWDVLSVLVSKELKLRYRGTTFGILWSLANPLAFTLVLYIAFKRVFQVEIENYPLFILSALFPWQWLSNSMNAASMLFFYNAALIKKLRFPRSALCLAVVLGDMIHFLVTIPVFAVLALFAGGKALGPVWLVGIPTLLVAQAALSLAAVIVIATVNAFLRDLEQLVRVFLLLLFYVTPVLYPVAMVPDGLHWLLVINPFAPLIIAWRALLTDGLLTPYIAIAVGYGFIALALALPVYRKLEWRLAEVV